LENKKDFLLIPAEWAETQPSTRLAYFPSPSECGQAAQQVGSAAQPAYQAHPPLRLNSTH
jgi:hypothetical protein